MTKMLRNVNKKFARLERGQVLVIVAVAAVGIIAIIGLALDVGLMFIGNARLRRAVDSAALAAALQYRQTASITDLTAAATEFLVLNGVTLDASNPVTVNTCITLASLCYDPVTSTTLSRKLVQVHATATLHLAFLPVIGIDSVPIAATAVSETASLDVVLVIDRSESMTYDADPSDPLRDPFYCNGFAPGSPSHYTDPYGYNLQSSCSPFNKVVSAAIQFANILFFPYDHAAVVTFDKQPTVRLTLNAGNSNAAVVNTLKALTVFQGEETVSDPNGSTAIFHGTGSAAPARCYGQVGACSPDFCGTSPDWAPGSFNYKGLLGAGQDPCLPGYVNPPDPSHYTTTNIGGGLQLAGNEFATDSRQQALWVVILLTDGVPNAGNQGSTDYCPHATWGNVPRCNDLNVAGDVNKASRPANSSTSYDASDFAYDMADFIGMPYPNGQNALMYTIGLGNEVTNYPQGFSDPWSVPANQTGEGLGTIFLNYAAHIGNGSAFYSSTGNDLNAIFRLIGSNIATRLSQ